MAIVQATKTGLTKDTISAAWNKYNNTVTALLIEHAAAGTHGVLTATTVNALTLTAAATGFTIAGGTTSKTLTLDANLTASYLADITSAEADQIEAIGTTTISAAQWGYLGACVAGGGQLIAALTAAESTQLEAIGAATINATQWGYLGACGAGGGQLIAALTAAESTQLEAIGAATINASQWGYLGFCGAGGGQLLAALTTGESDQLELIGATTISAAQWAWLGGYGINAKARAYRVTSVQSIATATATKIQLNAEDFDPGNNFDSATNYRFVAPVSGYYYVAGAISWAANTVVDHRVYTLLYKNGADQASSINHRSHDDILASAVSTVLYLAASNYVELWGYQDSGSACDVNYGINLTFFAVHFLSKA